MTGLCLLAAELLDGGMNGWMDGSSEHTKQTGRHERFGVFLRKRTTLAMEGFLCMVALAIVAMLSLFLEPYSDGWATSRGAPRGGQCFMMMEWKLLLPFCVLQVKRTNGETDKSVTGSTLVVSIEVDSVSFFIVLKRRRGRFSDVFSRCWVFRTPLRCPPVIIDAV